MLTGRPQLVLDGILRAWTLPGSDGRDRLVLSAINGTWTAEQARALAQFIGERFGREGRGRTCTGTSGS